MWSRAVRVVAAFVFTAVAVLAALLAWGALSNLWADYQDSPASTYLTIGGLALAASAAALFAAWRLWRER
jgi:hypothetical protein